MFSKNIKIKKTPQIAHVVGRRGHRLHGSTDYAWASASASSQMQPQPNTDERAAASGLLRRDGRRHFFYFYIFQNRFLQKYIFGFTIYRFIPLLPGRGAAGGRQGAYRTAGGGRLRPNIKAEVPPTCICSKQHP